MKNKILLALTLSLAAQSAMAAGGLGGIDTFLENISAVLKGVALVTLTIAFMIAGYKIAFGGSSIREVAPIAIGGIVVGAAAYLASLLI